MAFTRTCLRFALTITLAGAAAVCAPGAPAGVRIGASSSGSVPYALAVGLGSMLARHADISATAEPVGGSSANMFALDADRVDQAIVNAGAAYDALRGLQPFPRPVGVKLMAQGQPTLRQLVVRTGSGITSPADLVGRTLIGRRPALAEVELITSALLDAYGIASERVRVVSTTTTSEAVNALRNNTADAVIFPASRGTGVLESLAYEGRIAFLDIPADRMAAMRSALPPWLSTGVLAARTYTGQDRPVNVFVVSTYLVASTRLDDEVVYRVTRTLFDHLEEFHGFHAEAKEWTLEEALAEPKIPYHPGAIRYFRERGVWTPELDRIQAVLEQG